MTSQAVFIGGSRHISQLPDKIKARLDNIVSKGYHVLIGDADGVDKAVQHYLNSVRYENVTVFSSGGRTRNNVGSWQLQSVAVRKGVKGFDFYAVKDREMAKQADFGLMIWDCKSPGTILNVFRLVSQGKKTRLFNARDQKEEEIKSTSEWKSLVQSEPDSLMFDLRKRATVEELRHLDLNTVAEQDATELITKNETKPELDLSEHMKSLNAALSNSDIKALADAIASLSYTDKTRDLSSLASNVKILSELLSESGIQLFVKKKPKKRTATKKTKISNKNELRLAI